MKYTKELLLEILNQGNAVLLDEYTKYNQRLKVLFRCSCGKENIKRFEMLNLYRLPYCNECTMIKQRQKIEETCIKKYGYKNVAQNKEVKEKIKNTYLKNYGDHPKRIVEVQDKWKATCLEKYGGHPNQSPDVQAKSEKSSYKFKEYIFPSGNIVKYQGYENLALDHLLQSYKEEDIVVGRNNIPTINYYINNIKHVYFPDIFLPAENKIIEVKSDWSMNYKRSNIQEKAEATIKEGYLYEIWIYKCNKQRLKILRYS